MSQMISSTRIFQGAREKFKPFSKRLKTGGSKEKLERLTTLLLEEERKLEQTILSKPRALLPILLLLQLSELKIESLTSLILLLLLLHLVILLLLLLLLSKHKLLLLFLILLFLYEK